MGSRFLEGFGQNLKTNKFYKSFMSQKVPKHTYDYTLIVQSLYMQRTLPIFCPNSPFTEVILISLWKYEKF